MMSGMSFDGPAVSYSKENVALTAGMSVTVTGLSFGSVDFTVSGVMSAALCTTARWTSQTSVGCLTGSFGAITSDAVQVTVGAVAGTQVFGFTFDGPVVSYAGMNMAATGAESVTVSGLSFGSSDFTATSAVALGACSTSMWTSVTTARCRWGGAISRSQVVVVTIGAVSGTQVAGFSFDAPVASYPGIENMGLTGGLSLTVSGLSFGSMDYTASVDVGSVGCVSLSWQSGTALSCLAGSIASTTASKECITRKPPSNAALPSAMDLTNRMLAMPRVFSSGLCSNAS